jgi:hypothetical protein
MCFVSGHDFSRAVKSYNYEGFSWATEGRTDVFPRGIRLAPEVSTPIAKLLGAEAFQAEERRDQGIDIFKAVVERQRRTHRSLDPEPA